MAANVFDVRVADGSALSHNSSEADAELSAHGVAHSRRIGQATTDTSSIAHASPLMDIDPTNPVVALCAAGMAIEGDADTARRLFEQAWDARTDDYDASIAAHFIARHQPNEVDRQHWNALAVEHAERVTDGRARSLMASLYLNLADSLRATGDPRAAQTAIARARAYVTELPEDGYRSFVELGIARLEDRLAPPNRAQLAIDPDPSVRTT